MEILLFALLVILCFGKPVWSLFDHSETEPNAVLQSDAKIVDIDTKEVQYMKNGAKYKTTVRFSDGFVFTTHKTDRDDNFFSYRISISPELRREIIRNAIEAHDRALQKQR